MVIEYQIRRLDLVKAYFYNLRHSPRTRLIVFGAALLMFIYMLFLRNGVNKHLEITDFLVASLYAVGIVLALPVISVITAKTSEKNIRN